MPKAITYIDLFSGIGGFREGLSRAGGFVCVGHCEIDKYADQSYRALFDTKGEWFREDVRKADPDEMPDFDLLCGGFPCQSFSIAGHRGGFADPRGTLFFEIARLTAAKRPAYLLLLKTYPACLTMTEAGRLQPSSIRWMDWGMVWSGRCLTAKISASLNPARGCTLSDILMNNAEEKYFLSPKQQERLLSKSAPAHRGSASTPRKGVSCTLTSQAGGMGGKTGLYCTGVPIKENTKKGYKMAYPGDSVDLAYPTLNTRRGRVGRKIAHTITTGSSQGTLCCVDLNEEPELTDYARCLTAKQNGGIRSHKREASGVWDGCRIRRLTPRNACGSRVGQMSASTLSCRSNPTPSFTSRPETASPSMWWRPSESGWPPPIGR